MNINAIICEYNPFHYGHLYQIKKTKTNYPNDGILALMSGNFVQRGCPAIYDKHTRAQAAILNGADLVLELPVIYACQSAPIFAKGAVCILNALGAVNHLIFGTECGNLDPLYEIENIIYAPNHKKMYTDKQNNFPTVRSAILQDCGMHAYAHLLETPNNILATEYLHALKTTNSSMSPVTFQRNNQFFSAGKIRQMAESDPSVITSLPHSEVYKKSVPFQIRQFDLLATHILRTVRPENIRNIEGICAGVEYRICECAKKTYGFFNIAKAVKSKRFTQTRINRTLLNILLDIQKCDVTQPPVCVNVLAMNTRGKEMLHRIKNTTQIPVLTKRKKQDNQIRQIALESAATDLYNLCSNNTKSGLEFLTHPFILPK